jgi:rhodanese-related sulfurtransferase
VEYLVFAAPWRAGHREPPRFGTEPFVYTADDPATQLDEGHLLEPHYELHVWIPRDNPAGLFAQFNPRVSCAHYGSRAGDRVPDVLAGLVADGLPAGTQVSTEELRERLAQGGVLLLDARPATAFEREHLPGAVGLAPSDRTAAERADGAVRAVARALRMDRTRPIIVYGEGPGSAEARLAASALRAAGYTAVRRYQLGLAVWQAMGGVAAIGVDGVAAAWAGEPATLFLDAREPALRARDSLPGLMALPVPLAARAIAEERLPRDPATRIITVGRDAAQARALAEQLVRQAYRRVAFFEGDWERFRRAVSAERRASSSH